MTVNTADHRMPRRSAIAAWPRWRQTVLALVVTTAALAGFAGLRGDLSPVWLALGGIAVAIGVVGLARAVPGDAPRRRKTAVDESELRTEERNRGLVQAILGSAIDGIITIDETGCVQSFSPGAERIFGYTADEVCGQNVRLLMPPPYCDQHDERLARYLATGEKHVIGTQREVVALRRDGSTFPADISVSEVQWDHQHLFAGIIRDVTERRRAAQALREERDFAEELIRTAPVIVVVLDCDGHVVRFNDSFEKACGHRLEDFRGVDWFDACVPEAERAEVRRRFRKVLDSDRSRDVISSGLCCPAGRCDIEWHVTALRNADTPPTGMLAVGLNVTERKKLEAEFLQAQKMEAVGRLAGGIAHDFNNLLMGIIGCCRIAVGKLEDGHPSRALIEEIIGEAERGSGLTRQLLTFGRKRPLAPEPILLNAVVDRVEIMIRHLISEDIEVRVSRCGIGGPITADSAQIEQVLMNLVVNARDAMPGGGVLTIATDDVVLTEQQAGLGELPAGPYVTLRVQDTGIGMDRSTQARVFEPFFTTKGVGEGTGLGLSTAYGIVRQLRGHISLRSQVDRGTTFTVYLPRRDPAESTPIAVGSATPRRELRGDEVILVVEDEVLVRATVCHALEGLGYRTLAAGDAETAERIADAEGGAVALLLTDIVLPGMTGSELADKLRRRFPHLVTLYMSAYPNDYLVDRGRIRAGEPSLEKPFSDETLGLRVRELLVRRVAPEGGS